MTCPVCGDRYLIYMRCTGRYPVRTCRTPGSNHTHCFCTRCAYEWRHVPVPGELAYFAPDRAEGKSPHVADRAA